MTPRRPCLDLRILGYPEVRWDREEVKLPTQKSLAILCYVVVRGRPATRDELAELLWPAGAAANLRPELHRLRRLPGAASWLRIDETIVVDAQSDLARFEFAVEEECFEEALALHAPSEELLRGLEPKGAPAFAEWLAIERERVRSTFGRALRGRALVHERDGAFAEAVGLARAALEIDPFDESTYRIAMRSDYRRGRVEEALAHAEACRRVLAIELGAEPSAETLELERTIRAAAPLPDARPAQPPRRIPLALLRPPTLVGREREWSRLQEAWDAGRAINVSGPAGIGKSRLLLDFARAHGPSFLLEGRPGDHVVPYSSLARALRAALRDHPAIADEAPEWVMPQIARILPDVAPAPATAEATVEAQTRLFEAIVHLMGLLRRRVASIVVDDLQYLDAKSFEVGMAAQARLLTERAEPGRARLMAAFRRDELPVGFAWGLRMAVAAGLATHVALEPLDDEALAALLVSLELGHDPRLAPSLQRLTGGNPQFLVETLKSAHEGRVEELLSGATTTPSAVTEIIERRLADLEPLALRLARTIAVLDQPADPDALAAVTGRSAFEVTESLAELEAAQVLRDGRFVHDLLRETVARLTPAATRAWLHGRVAEILERTAADPRRVAHHRYQAETIESARSN